MKKIFYFIVLSVIALCLPACKPEAVAPSNAISPSAGCYAVVDGKTYILRYAYRDISKNGTEIITLTSCRLTNTNGYLDFENETYDYFEMMNYQGLYSYSFGHEAGGDFLYANNLDETITPLLFQISGGNLSLDINNMEVEITYTGKNHKQGKMSVHFSGSIGATPK